MPLNRSLLQIELFARWGAPVVLVASTRLGTINHSLLSVEALKRRQIPLLGIAFVGDENAEFGTHYRGHGRRAPPRQVAAS